MALLHDSASRQRDICMACAAPQYDRLSLGKTVRLANIPALETRKPLRPPQVLKVSCAGRVIGEYPLKFWERRREPTGIHDRNLALEFLIGNKPDRQEINYQLLRYDNDTIVHFSEWSSLENAHRFFESPELVELRKKAGVQAPNFIYLQEIERGVL